METKLMTCMGHEEANIRMDTDSCSTETLFKLEVLQFKKLEKLFWEIVFITCRESEEKIDTIRNTNM